MRLIDAIGLKQALAVSAILEDKKTIGQIIDEQPTAEPDIIRCKDCKYYKYGICRKIGVNKSFYGFCDWAERRKDG